MTGASGVSLADRGEGIATSNSSSELLDDTDISGIGNEPDVCVRM